MNALLKLAAAVAISSLFGACRTAPGLATDLSMRFTHPELYTTRYWFPREQALAEMRDFGLLHRGMAWETVHRLLGYPDMTEKYDGSSVTIAEGIDQGEKIISTTDSSIPAKEVWIYYLKRSKLRIHFTPRRLKATRFEWRFEKPESIETEHQIW